MYFEAELRFDHNPNPTFVHRTWESEGMILQCVVCDQIFDSHHCTQ